MYKKTLDKRKEVVLNWLKNPYNFALVTIILFAIIIRLYYFVLTKSQPLWWDAASYGALAKNFVYHTWDGTTLINGELIIRPLLFPLLWSLLLRFNTTSFLLSILIIYSLPFLEETTLELLEKKEELAQIHYIFMY